MEQQQRKTGTANRNVVNNSAPGTGDDSSNEDLAPKTAKSIKDIKLYKLDPRGFLVTDIFWCTQDYVIYKADGRVSPMFSDDEVEAREQRLRYMQLGQSLARINSLEPGSVIQRRHPVFGEIKKLFRFGRGETEQVGTGSSDDRWNEGKATSRDYFSREIARAVALCLEGMVSEGRQILDALEHKIVSLKQNEYRMLYLFACFMLMAIYVVMVLYLTYVVDATPNGSDLSLFIANNSVLLRATLMGVLAGFFSVSLGIQNLDFDLDARYYLIISYGFMRLFVAIIASLFIFFAIRSGFVFANLQSDISTGNATLYVLAFLSGFSEHFVPNVLKKIELGQHADTKVDKGKGKAMPDGGDPVPEQGESIKQVSEIKPPDEGVKKTRPEESA